MQNKILNSYNICFLGRTGNGKSSLINSLFGTSLTTDPLVPCTKHLSVSTIISDRCEGYNSVAAYDTPGIGEFSDNTPYQLYYQHAVRQANCIVLVTTLDRTDAPAQRLLLSLKKFLDQKRNPQFIVALNHIDSRTTIGSQEDTVWDNECNCPTSYRMNQIQERILIIKEKFESIFLPLDVVPVCALRGSGIEQLKTSIWKTSLRLKD